MDYNFYDVLFNVFNSSLTKTAKPFKPSLNPISNSRFPKIYYFVKNH